MNRPARRITISARTPFSGSLRTKLFASYCVVIVLFMLCASVVAAWRVETYLADEAGAAYEDVLRQADATVTSRAGIYERLLYSVYISDAMSQVFHYNPADEFVAFDRQNQLQRLISSLTSTYEGLLEVRIYDYRNGKDARSIVAASKIEDKRWEQKVLARKGTGVVWAVLRERSSAQSAHHSVLCVAKPYYTRATDECLAIVCVRVDYDRFFSGLRELSVFNEGALMLRGAGGEEFYAGGPMAEELRRMNPDELLGQGAGEVRAFDSGTARLMHVYNEQMDALLVGAVPQDLPARAARAMSGFIIGLSLGLAALGIIINYIITRSITKGLAKLTGKVTRAFPGQGGDAAPPAGRDELMALNGAFDTMLARLNDYTEQLAELRTREVKLQLKALQDQINPHFLYNTLSNIGWMAQGIGADELTNTVNNLARFYRIGLSRGHPVIPIQTEIEHVRAYIEIVRLRLNSAVVFVFDLDPDAMDCLTPKTVLQPLVENALHHGFEESGRSGTIAVHVAREGDTVVMEVEDDGAGMDARRVESVLAGDVRSSGYGLYNISERIRLYFGEGYGLTIWSEPGRGSRMRVRIPAQDGTQGQGG